MRKLLSTVMAAGLLVACLQVRADDTKTTAAAAPLTQEQQDRRARHEKMMSDCMGRQKAANASIKAEDATSTCRNEMRAMREAHEKAMKDQAQGSSTGPAAK